MILYILIGFVSGIISGMGIGGGAILIPSLTIFFGMSQHMAQSTNLIYFIPTAIIALITHNKSNNLQKNIMPKLIIFGIIGTIIGSLIAIKTTPELLKSCFGYFLIGMGSLEFFKGISKK